MQRNVGLNDKQANAHHLKQLNLSQVSNQNLPQTLDNFRLLAGSCSMKNIDLKSFLIGFFMATTLLLAVGASKGPEDVRIVGIDKSFTDWDAIIVETE